MVVCVRLQASLSVTIIVIAYIVHQRSQPFLVPLHLQEKTVQQMMKVAFPTSSTPGAVKGSPRVTPSFDDGAVQRGGPSSITAPHSVTRKRGTVTSSPSRGSAVTVDNAEKMYSFLKLAEQASRHMNYNHLESALLIRLGHPCDKCLGAAFRITVTFLLPVIK